MKSGIAILFLSIIHTAVCAQKYTAGTSQPSTVAVTSVAGHHTARGVIDTAWLNTKTRSFFCRIAVKDFNFGVLPMFASKRTVVHRFLTSYMEMDKYPFITYEGALPAFWHNAFEDGDTIMTKGVLTAHGVSKEVQIPVVLTKRDKQLLLYSQFAVKAVDDYKVKAAPGIRYRYLNDVKIQVSAVLTGQ